MVAMLGVYRRTRLHQRYVLGDPASLGYVSGALAGSFFLPMVAVGLVSILRGPTDADRIPAAPESSDQRVG